MGRKETQIMMYAKKNILRVLTKLFKLKRKKMAYETKCQILNDNKKNWLVRIKDNVKKILT